MEFGRLLARSALNFSEYGEESAKGRDPQFALWLPSPPA
jgi:hypothetical protein